VGREQAGGVAQKGSGAGPETGPNALFEIGSSRSGARPDGQGTFSDPPTNATPSDAKRNGVDQEYAGEVAETGPDPKNSESEPNSLSAALVETGSDRSGARPDNQDIFGYALAGSTPSSAKQGSVGREAGEVAEMGPGSETGSESSALFVVVDSERSGARSGG